MKMPEVYQIWDYDTYIDEMKEHEENIKNWFKTIDEIGQNNKFTNDDIAELEFCLAMLDEYGLIDLREVQYD